VWLSAARDYLVTVGDDQTSGDIDAALRAARSWLQRRAAKERATVYGWDAEVPGPAAERIYATLQRAMADDMAADLIQNLVDQRETRVVKGQRGEPAKVLAPDEELRPLVKYRRPDGRLAALPADEQTLVVLPGSDPPVYGVIVSNSSVDETPLP
jgi:hypothetical protein